MQSVGDWLDRLGLGQYENTLVANGYDDTDFLVSNFSAYTMLMKITFVSLRI